MDEFHYLTDDEYLKRFGNLSRNRAEKLLDTIDMLSPSVDYTISGLDDAQEEIGRLEVKLGDFKQKILKKLFLSPEDILTNIESIEETLGRVNYFVNRLSVEES
jgi:uncharacterized protein Yka (UPF0111/DUF47 family)